MTRGVTAAAVAATVWCVAAWLLWRTSVPAFALPHIDPGTVFGPAVLHRAERYSRGLRLFWLGSVVVKLVVLGLFVRYGVRWTRESAAGPIGTGMVLGMLGFALVWLAQLPPYALCAPL